MSCPAVSRGQSLVKSADADAVEYSRTLLHHRLDLTATLSHDPSAVWSRRLLERCLADNLLSRRRFEWDFVRDLGIFERFCEGRWLVCRVSLRRQRNRVPRQKDNSAGDGFLAQRQLLCVRFAPHHQPTLHPKLVDPPGERPPPVFIYNPPVFQPRMARRQNHRHCRGCLRADRTRRNALRQFLRCRNI